MLQTINKSQYRFGVSMGTERPLELEPRDDQESLSVQMMVHLDLYWLLQKTLS